MKEQIRNERDENKKKEYIKKFRKEVDFHHKVCYRFEKAYRLSKEAENNEYKENNPKEQELTLEIVAIISEHADYIEAEPMAIFYCLYFCIYYKNITIVNFLRSLV
jgi:hypothetical protein